MVVAKLTEVNNVLEQVPWCYDVGCKPIECQQSCVNFTSNHLLWSRSRPQLDPTDLMASQYGFCKKYLRLLKFQFPLKGSVQILFGK